MDKKRFFCYGYLPYMAVKDYINSEEWQYSGTEQDISGSYWDIVENPYTGEYAYTNLEDIDHYIDY